MVLYSVRFRINIPITINKVTIKRRFLNEFHGCIIGSGPSGLYLAQDLLKRSSHKGIDLFLDIYDKLSTPYGLVRYGVAPDHQDVKNVETTFEKILQNPRVSLLAGVDIGTSITLDELKQLYNFIVLCYGQFLPRLLNIEGEKFKNIYTSQSFVSWYNGHPSSLKMNVPNLKVKCAVVIGLGNVAIDIARLLLTDFNKKENTFDIPEHVLKYLKDKEIEKVLIIGRGAVTKIAFTIKEFRELSNRSNLLMKIASNNFDNIKIEEEPKNRQRLLKLVKEVSQRKYIDYDVGLVVECEILFEKIPIRFHDDGNQNVQRLVIRDKNTGIEQIIDCELVVTSIGYSGCSIDPTIKYDSTKGCIPNIEGRVIKPTDEDIIKGIYCNGWIKTGPRGNIATTLVDTYHTSNVILKDIESGILNIPVIKGKEREYGKKSALKILQKRNINPKSYNDWKLINKQEKQIGGNLNKIREKFVDQSIIDDIISR